MGKMLKLLRENEAKERANWGILMPKLNKDEASMYEMQQTIVRKQQTINSLRQQVDTLQRELLSYANKSLDVSKPKYEEAVIHSLFDAEDLVRKVFGITIEEMFNTSRKDRNIMRAKHVGRFIAHVGFGMALKDVATRYGKANHTTALHSKKYICRWYDSGMMPSVVIQLLNTCCQRQIFDLYDSNM